jgi:hypothetical protein
MEKTILMDKILKLIIEDISVTRPEQISKQLNIDNNTVLSLLKEMEQSKHIQLLTVSGGVHVIVLKSAGRQFYKSSGSKSSESYVDSREQRKEDKIIRSSKITGKTLTWTIIGIAVLLALIIGYKQGWFS